MISKKDFKNKRSSRIRSKLKRTSNLRLCAFRSSKHIYIQVIDDKNGRTILSASSHDDTLTKNKGQLTKLK